MKWETDWLESHARLTPNQIAIIDGETKESSTFAELNDRASRIADKLVLEGIKKGDRIAILTPNHESYFEILFAAAKMGAIFVPLNYRLSPNELSYIIKDAGAKFLFYHIDFEHIIEQINLVLTEINTICIQSNYNDWLNHTKRFELDGCVSPSDPWVIIYTGGTTGLPKGVVLTHNNMIWNAINTIVSWKLSHKDRTYTILPLFHTGALNALSIPILYTGGTIVLGTQFDPFTTLRVIEEEKVTILLLVPTMHHMVIHHPKFDKTDFKHNPIFLSGGAPCPLPIYEGYSNKGLRFKEGYGLTEAGPNNFYLSPEEANFKKGSVGKPMVHNQISLIDDRGSKVADGEVGEIVIEGPHVFAYYWNNTEATEKTLKNGKLFTGDLARKDHDGFYYIVGRKKEMIISGGENIYPLEVENILQNHPNISEAVVVGIEDNKWGEKVVAFIVFKQGEQKTDEELRAYCHQYLARYKTPKQFCFIDELPKTPVGKIDKKRLRLMYQE